MSTIEDPPPEPRKLRDAEFEALLVESVPYVRGCALLQAGADLRERVTISDIVQSALRDLWEARDAYRFVDLARHRSYLWRVTTNKILEKRRFHDATCRRANAEEPFDELKHGGMPARSEDPADRTPSAVVLRSEEFGRLQKAMGALDDQDCQLLTLRNLLDASWTQIAAELGMPETTVRYRHAVAMAKLAAALGRPRP